MATFNRLEKLTDASDIDSTELEKWSINKRPLNLKLFISNYIITKNNINNKRVE